MHGWVGLIKTTARFQDSDEVMGGGVIFVCVFQHTIKTPFHCILSLLHLRMFEMVTPRLVDTSHGPRFPVFYNWILSGEKIHRHDI